MKQMSKKTENINQSIEKIKEYADIISQLKNKYLFQDELSKELDDISFGINQEIEKLRFWFNSLYVYNGKSTSNAKKTASRENGKKGGRPLKEVTLKKRRILELENEIIPKLEHDLKFTDDIEEEKNIRNQLEKAESEIEELRRKNQ